MRCMGTGEGRGVEGKGRGGGEAEVAPGQGTAPLNLPPQACSFMRFARRCRA